MDGEADAFFCPAIATYTVGLTAFESGRAREAGLPGLDTAESLAAGYLRDGVFHAAAYARRTKKQPLPRELEIPVSGGEPCLRITDIWGERRFFLRRPPPSASWSPAVFPIRRPNWYSSPHWEIRTSRLTLLALWQLPAFWSPAT